MPINLNHNKNTIITDDGLINFDMTGAIIVPIGTTDQRPDSPNNGYLRYNTTLAKFEGFTNFWDEIGKADQTAGEIEAIVNHNNLIGFVANEHIDWTTNQGATNINAGNYTDTVYIHPSDGVDLGAALTGATVISDVNVNTAGHVTGFTTRAITAGDIGAIPTGDIALGSDTSGNYVATITGTTNEIQVFGSGGETAGVTIGLPDNVTITGNLTINGTTTTVNSTTVTIDDPVFTLGGDSPPASTDSKDRGIEFRYFDTAARIGFFGYDDSTNRFTATGVATNTNEVFSGTTLDAEFGTVFADLIGNATTATTWATGRTITLTGAVIGVSGPFDGSGNLSFATTIAANSVALGTDTTGNYVETVTGTTNEITVSGSGSETAGVTIGLPNAVTISGAMTAGSFIGDGSALTGVASSAQGTTADAALPRTGGTMTGNISFGANERASFGGSDEFQIFQANNASLMTTSATNLRFSNTTTDGDIRLQADNGSGGVTTYFTADGSTGEALMYHYGNRKLVTKATGVDITGTLAASDFAGDGSALTGLASAAQGAIADAALPRAGGTITGTLTLSDNVDLSIGTNNDLQVFHTGSLTRIDTNTGDLIVRTLEDDKRFILQADNGSGGVTTYLTADGSTGEVQLNYYGATKLVTSVTGVDVTGTMAAIDFAGDGSALTGVASSAQGTTADAALPRAGGTMTGALEVPTATLKSATGSGTLNIVSSNNVLNAGQKIAFFGANRSDADEEMAYIQSLLSSNEGGAGNVQSGELAIGTSGTEVIRIDDAGKVGIGTSTPSANLDVVGDVKVSGDLSLGDNGQLNLGANADFEMFYDGTLARMDVNTGDLLIRMLQADKRVIIQADNGAGGNANYIIADGSTGEVSIRHYGNPKLSTKAGGVDVTGDLAVSGDITSDGLTLTGLMQTTADIKLGDGDRLLLGAANDFQIAHNGTTTVMNNYAGDLAIAQHVDDGSLRLLSDDGAGGTTDYVKCNGSNGEVELRHYGAIKLATKAGGVDVTGDLSLPDNGIINLGAGSDLQIFHDGSNSYIVDNGTGDLYLRASSNIYLQSAGGTKYLDATASGDVNLYYANALKISTTATGVSVIGDVSATGDISLTNGGKLQLGTNNDFLAYHNGTHGFIENDTGEMYIRQLTNDGRMLFQADNGSGATDNYIVLNGATGEVELRYGNAIKLATKAGGVDVTGDVNVSNDVNLGDNGQINLGAAADFEMFHDGTLTRMEVNTGDLILRVLEDDKRFIVQSDDGAGALATYLTCDGSTGEVILRHYGSTKLQTKAGGVDISGTLTATDFAGDGSSLAGVASSAQGALADAALPRTGGTMTGSIDYGTNRAKFGSSDELQILQSNLVSLITAESPGLWIRNTATDGVIQLQADNGSGSNTVYVELDGATGEVQLKHYGNLKLATKATGVDVVGNITVSGEVDGVDLSGVTHLETTAANASASRFAVSSDGTQGNNLALFRDLGTDGAKGTSVQVQRVSSTPSGIANPKALRVLYQVDNGGDDGTTIPWCISGEMDNYDVSTTTGETGTAVSGISRKWASNSGVTFGGHFQAIDNSRPVAGNGPLVAIEVGVKSNGPDTNTNRVGIDLIAKSSYDEVGDVPGVMTAGLRVRNSRQKTGSWTTGIEVGNDNGSDGMGLGIHIATEKTGAKVGAPTLANTIGLKESGNKATGISMQGNYDDNAIDILDTSTAVDRAIRIRSTGNVVAALTVPAGELIGLDDAAMMYIGSDTNNINIRNRNVDKNVSIQSDNGAGGVATYFQAQGISGEAAMFHYGSEKLTTKAGGVDVTGTLTATDFAGDGSALTGVASSAQGALADAALPITGGTMTGQLTSPNINLTGSLNFTGTGASFIYSNDGGEDIEIRVNNSQSATATDLLLRGRGANDTITNTIQNTIVSQISSTGLVVTGTVAATSYTGDGSALTGISSSTSIAQVRNTSAISNLNGSTSFTDVAITGISDFMDTGFTAGSTGIICGFTGRIAVTVHILQSASSARTNVKVRAAVGGVGSPIEGATGYIRATSDHNESSSTATSFMSVTSGDEVTLQTQREAALGTVQGPAGSCMISVKRI